MAEIMKLRRRKGLKKLRQRKGSKMSKVAWDYIVPIVMHKDLKGVTPGKLPESLLRPIPGGGKLHWRAADAWNAMVAKAKADGLVLKPTSSGDLYRSYE